MQKTMQRTQDIFVNQGYICGVNQEVNYMEERTKGPMNVKQL